MMKTGKIKIIKAFRVDGFWHSIEEVLKFNYLYKEEI